MRKLPAPERPRWDAPDPEIVECYDRTLDRTLRPYPPGWYCGAQWAIDRRARSTASERCPRCGRSWLVASLRLWSREPVGRGKLSATFVRRTWAVRAASLDFPDVMYARTEN